MLSCWLIELKNKKTGLPPLSQWLSAPVILPVDWEFRRLFVKQFVRNRGPFDSRSGPAYSTVWVHAICIYVCQYYNAMLILCMLSDIVCKKRENLFCCDKIWEDLTVTVGEQTVFPNVKDVLSPASVSSRVYNIETNWVSLDMRVSLKSLYRALNNC